MGGGREGIAPALDWGSRKRGVAGGMIRSRPETECESCVGTVIVNYSRPWEEGGARPRRAENPDGGFQVLPSLWSDSRPQAICLISLNFTLLDVECKG